MKKKRIAVYLCAGMLALSLAACGDDAQGESGSQGTEQTSSTDEQQESGGSQEGTEDTSSAESDSAGDDNQGGDDGDGSTAMEGWSEEMEGLKSLIVEALGEDAQGYSNYWPDMALDAEMLETRFGVSPEMYDDYMGEIPMMSAHVDTLVIVKAKEDQVDAVREALEAYREAQINDTLQYPANLGKIQASKVETAGNYVIFAMLGGDDMEAADNGEDAQIAFCQEKNDLVIDTIKGELGL